MAYREPIHPALLLPAMFGVEDEDNDEKAQRELTRLIRGRLRGRERRRRELLARLGQAPHAGYTPSIPPLRRSGLNTQDESTRVLTKALLGSTVWKTDKGLGSLSTEAVVIRAYGSPEQVGPSTIIYRRDTDVQEVKTKVLLCISQGIRFALFDDPRAAPVNGRVFEIGVFKPNAKL